MFYEIAQFTKLLLSPVSWIVALIIIPYFLNARRKWLRRSCWIVAGLMFLVFSNKPLLFYTEGKLAAEYSTPTMKEGKTYKAAIVLGGFSKMDADHGNLIYESRRAGRLWEAVRLWKMGRVERILITGDMSCSLKEGHTTKPEFLKYMSQIGVPDSVILVEQLARNTHENATFSKAILDSLGISSSDCVLVTSATHMRRSYEVFKKEGMNVDYYASDTNPESMTLNHRDFYPRWKYVQEWQYIFNELFGRIIYAVAGYG